MIKIDSNLIKKALSRDEMKQIKGGSGTQPWGWTYSCTTSNNGFSTIGWWVNSQLANSVCGAGNWTKTPIF